MTIARDIASIQTILGTGPEYGPTTIEAVKAYQSVIGAWVDGEWGPATERDHRAYIADKVEAARVSTITANVRPLASILLTVGDTSGVWSVEAYEKICAEQKSLGVTPDGFWGKGTENAYVRRMARQEAYTRGISTDPLPVVEVARVAKAAGFIGDALVKAVAVALAESGKYSATIGWCCDPVARLVNVGKVRSVDRGTWQINDYWHPEVIDWKTDTPALAAKEAYRISSRGTNWTQWATFNSGSWLNHEARAAAAVKSLG